MWQNEGIRFFRYTFRSTINTQFGTKLTSKTNIRCIQLHNFYVGQKSECRMFYYKISWYINNSWARIITCKHNKSSKRRWSYETNKGQKHWEQAPPLLLARNGTGSIIFRTVCLSCSQRKDIFGLGIIWTCAIFPVVDISLQNTKKINKKLISRYSRTKKQSYRYSNRRFCALPIFSPIWYSFMSPKDKRIKHVSTFPSSFRKCLQSEREIDRELNPHERVGIRTTEGNIKIKRKQTARKCRSKSGEYLERRGSWWGAVMPESMPGQYRSTQPETQQERHSYICRNATMEYVSRGTRMPERGRTFERTPRNSKSI